MEAATSAEVLPRDAESATLIGRLWDPASGGPRVVAVRGDRLVDLSHVHSTVSSLLEQDDPVSIALHEAAPAEWALADVLESTVAQSPNEPRLLSPIDLQVIKACGVTFVDSMIERVIEERSAGDPALAASVRTKVLAAIGGSLASVQPGSAAAAAVKSSLIDEGMWSQYLEVGIGPDPEIFTKGPVLSSVGAGAQIGVPTFSAWNNPEPELVLIVDSRGRVRGAALGNDVNLRDVEGRSALLLGMAKDNNASTAIGPFIRLFDDDFSIEQLRDQDITVTVRGTDGYELRGTNSLSRISRPFESLVKAAHGAHHQYPDGFALFTGTLFAPTDDRDEPDQGFTHKLGDVVTISTAYLGALTNVVGRTEDLPPWTFGISELIAYLRADT